MAQANIVDLASRRSFLTRTASVAAAGTAFALTGGAKPALAAPADEPLDASKASPALRAAIVDLRESHDRLEAAKARFTADDLTVSEWEANNPRPASKRAIKRWARKWRDYRDGAEYDSWRAQLAAEKDFAAAQLAVARVTPLDENDLLLKAAAAFVYDKVKTVSGFSIAIISYSVAQDLIKSWGIRGG